MLLIAYCSRIQVYCYDQNVGGRHIIFPIVKQEAQLSQKGRARNVSLKILLSFNVE